MHGGDDLMLKMASGRQTHDGMTMAVSLPHNLQPFSHAMRLENMMSNDTSTHDVQDDDDLASPNEDFANAVTVTADTGIPQLSARVNNIELTDDVVDEYFATTTLPRTTKSFVDSIRARLEPAIDRLVDAVLVTTDDGVWRWPSDDFMREYGVHLQRECRRPSFKIIDFNSLKVGRNAAIRTLKDALIALSVTREEIAHANYLLHRERDQSMTHIIKMRMLHLRTFHTRKSVGGVRCDGYEACNNADSPCKRQSEVATIYKHGHHRKSIDGKATDEQTDGIVKHERGKGSSIASADRIKLRKRKFSDQEDILSLGSDGMLLKGVPSLQMQQSQKLLTLDSLSHKLEALETALADQVNSLQWRMSSLENKAARFETLFKSILPGTASEDAT